MRPGEVEVLSTLSKQCPAVRIKLGATTVPVHTIDSLVSPLCFNKIATVLVSALFLALAPCGDWQFVVVEMKSPPTILGTTLKLFFLKALSGSKCPTVERDQFAGAYVGYCERVRES